MRLFAWAGFVGTMLVAGLGCTEVTETPVENEPAPPAAEVPTGEVAPPPAAAGLGDLSVATVDEMTQPRRASAGSHQALRHVPGEVRPELVLQRPTPPHDGDP